MNRKTWVVRVPAEARQAAEELRAHYNRSGVVAWSLGETVARVLADAAAELGAGRRSGAKSPPSSNRGGETDKNRSSGLSRP